MVSSRSLARIPAGWQARQIERAEICVQDRAIGRDTSIGAAEKRAIVRHRRSIGDERKDVIERGVRIDCVTGADDQLFVEVRIPCEADARLEVRVDLRDFIHGTIAERQRSIPEGGAGIGFAGHGFVMQLVDRLAEELPAHAKMQRQGAEAPSSRPGNTPQYRAQ